MIGEGAAVISQDTDARLVVVSGESTGDVFSLEGDVVSLGREPGNRIWLADPALSRRHCEFVAHEGRWRVRDVASSNGTFVNGVQVTEHTLHDGDSIVVGDSVLLYVRGRQANNSGGHLVDEAAQSPTICVDPDASEYLQARPRRQALDETVARGYRALIHITSVIHAIRDERELLRELLRLLVEAVPAQQGAIVMGDDDELSIVASHDAAGEGDVRVSRTAVRRALAERAGILCADATLDESFRSARSLAAASVQSLICVPIISLGRPCAAVYLSTTRPDRPLDEEHLQLVSAAARLAGTAIDNVRHAARLEREADRLHAELHLSHAMLGESSAMRGIYEIVQRTARANATVLISGETGTGKELAARAIHLNSARARAPFVPINCAALTESLLESELFGHERGAFTGAVAQKKGKLEVAHGGSVFLDEVGELPLGLQSKLLRILQEREFERVGGTRAIKVDIRVIAATNRDLAADVAAGRFRQDLYFRLNVIRIHMPALRHRHEDIPLLARSFLERYAGKVDRRIDGISADALACLEAYDWPGNVRELENTIERAVVLGTTPQVLPEDLGDAITDAARFRGGAGGAHDFHTAVREAKIAAIVAAFRQANGTYVEAARLLGVHPNYLHRLIRVLDIKHRLKSD